MKISRLSAGFFAGILFNLSVLALTSAIDNKFLRGLSIISTGVGLLFIADMFSKPEYKGNKLNGEKVNLNGVSVDVKEDEDKKRIVSVSMIHKSDSIKLINFLRTLTSPDNLTVTEMEEQE